MAGQWLPRLAGGGYHDLGGRIFPGLFRFLRDTSFSHAIFFGLCCILPSKDDPRQNALSKAKHKIRCLGSGRARPASDFHGLPVVAAMALVAGFSPGCFVFFTTLPDPICAVFCLQKILYLA